MLTAVTFQTHHVVTVNIKTTGYQPEWEGMLLSFTAANMNQLGSQNEINKYSDSLIFVSVLF